MSVVELRAFDNYFSANIVLTWLQARGIICYLKDEYTVTIDPLLSNAIGGIKLVTHARNQKEAFTLLKEYDEDFRNTVECPVCGGDDFMVATRQTTPNLIIVFLSWLFANYAVSSENVYRCNNCGYENAQLPERLS